MLRSARNDDRATRTDRRGAVLAFAALLLVCGCAGYASRVQKARSFYEAGLYDSAVTELQSLEKRDDNDRLLYLMDLGLVYHAAGRYADAIQTFLEAEKLADAKDFTRVSEEVGAVITNDDAKFYGGEDFERILINVYLAIDYTLSAQWDEALVECRKVNHRLDQMIQKGQVPYERNAFAKYLAAVLFESQGELNSAFVDYRQLYKWNPSLPLLGSSLLRVADRLQASQEFEQYRAAFPDVKDYKLQKGWGEIVLILEQGKSPVKIPSYQLHLVPVFARRQFTQRHAVVWDAKNPKLSARSRTFFDIEETAVRELNAKLAGIVAKKLAGVAAKEAIGAGVGAASDNKFLGALTSLFLHLQDKADLRSWTTLPANLQIARLKLPAGRHDIALDMVDGSGSRETGLKTWTGLEVKPGRVTFLNFRSLD